MHSQLPKLYSKKENNTENGGGGGMKRSYHYVKKRAVCQKYIKLCEGNTSEIDIN